MRSVATVAAIQAGEDAFFAANPGVDLMAVAAGNVAAEALDLIGAQGSRVLVAVGPGNNGGDGLFAAVNLARAGCEVAVWPVTDRAHQAGAQAAREAGCVFVDAVEAMAGLAEADLVVDAVLGIGGHPGLPGGVAEFALACTDLGVPVLAVDLPSGLVADSHELPSHNGRPGCFRATRTLTFAAPKLCHVAEPARSACGQVEVADIGLTLADQGLRQAETTDVARLWPFPTPTSDKYSRGVVGIDAGSARYPGAGVLACLGAVYAGAGMVRFCGPTCPSELIAQRLPSVTFGPGRVQTWLAGCGWGDRDDAAARLSELAADGVPMVVDADGLRYLQVALPAGSLLTPHAGELAALLGVTRAEVVADPIGQAQAAARRFSATVLLKGATQYVAEPSGRVTIAVEGPSWTAQAGSGDTLAGVCATLLASGLSAVGAGVLGASIQAMAAAARPGSWPPDRVAEQIPKVLASLAQAAADASLSRQE